jgi:hypothetical protein
MIEMSDVQPIDDQCPTLDGNRRVNRKPKRSRPNRTDSPHAQVHILKSDLSRGPFSMVAKNEPAICLTDSHHGGRRSVAGRRLDHLSEERPV